MSRRKPPFPTWWHVEFAERMKKYRGLKGVAAVRRKGARGPLVQMTYATAKMLEDRGTHEIVAAAPNLRELKKKLEEVLGGEG